MCAPGGEINPAKTAGGENAGRQVVTFVVGMWRSGTSLLHTLLSRHPQIALLYEAEPFDLWPAHASAKWNSDWVRRQEFFNQMLTRHRLRPEQLATSLNARDASLGLYQAFGRDKNARVIGEKSPAYHSRLAELAEIFPEAHFIIIWRDPLECCQSAAKAGRTNRFFGQRGTLTRMLFGTEPFARGVRRLHQKNRAVYELVYNELVKDPETHLRGICDFLGIPFSPAMLDLAGADLSSLPEGKHHAAVREGRIVQSSTREELLSPAFVSKGRRYAALWHRRYPELALGRALESNRDAIGPGVFERFFDRVRYAGWQSLAEVKRQLFRRIPLAWWSGLRRRGKKPVRAESPHSNTIGVMLI